MRFRSVKNYLIATLPVVFTTFSEMHYETVKLVDTQSSIHLVCYQTDKLYNRDWNKE